MFWAINTTILSVFSMCNVFFLIRYSFYRLNDHIKNLQVFESDFYKKKTKLVIKLSFILVDILDKTENILFVYIDVITSDEHP